MRSRFTREIVTATLAEIYANQGEYENDEAYRTLAASAPQCRTVPERLAELEELKKNAAGTRET